MIDRKEFIVGDDWDVVDEEAVAAMDQAASERSVKYRRRRSKPHRTTPPEMQRALEAVVLLLIFLCVFGIALLAIMS
jgi:hypothetical protein